MLFSTKEASSGERDARHKPNSKSGHIFDEEFDEIEEPAFTRKTVSGVTGSSKARNQLSSLVQHRENRQKKTRRGNQLSAEDMQNAAEKQEQLIETILIEEENIMDSHKQFIDDMIGCIKDDSEAFQSYQHDGRLLV